MSAEILDAGADRLEEFTETESTVPQYLTFVVGDEVYGIPIEYIAEIIGAQQLTAVPDPREYMRGVINLRGTVIPVMDVRARLTMEPRDADSRTCIVVVNLAEIVVGLLVDTISDVIDVPANAIEAAPRRKAAALGDSIVTGLVKIDGEVKILVNLGRLLHETTADRCGRDDDGNS